MTAIPRLPSVLFPAPGRLVLACAGSLLLCAALRAEAPRAPDLDYFGAPPPGNTPEIFAPGIVSRPDRFEARIAFSPDGRDCFLTETDATFSHPTMLAAHRDAGGWTAFAPAPFAAKFKFCHEPFFSADNRRLYFTADGNEAEPRNLRDFWMVERTDRGWTEPTRLPAPINSDAIEFCLSEAADGTLVFASNRPGGQGIFDLYRVEPHGDRAINLGSPINTAGPEFDPCLAADGSFLIFAGAARDGGQNLDLLISYRTGAHQWTAPAPLPGKVNTAANEYAPVLSPDGRYLFFVRHDGKQSDVFWISTASFRSPPSAP